MFDKSKLWNLGVPVLLALMAVCGVILAVQSFAPPVPIEAESRAIVGPRVPYETHYQVVATADHWAQLVDLSDNPEYPHANTESIILKSLLYAGDLSSVTHWHWNVGVVVATPTVTDTDIVWITEGALLRATRIDDRWPMPEHGLNLLPSGGKLMFVQSNQITTTVAITSGTILPSPADCLTGTAGIGDLILFLDEVIDTATLHFSIDTIYDTD